MRVFCETFGCTTNKGDSEIMLGCLKVAGHEPVGRLADADVIVVNTCAVKGPTQRRVLRRLRELRELGGKLIVVAGCLPLIDLASIERLGTFAGIISCHSVDSIVPVVERIARGETDVRVLGRVPREKPCLPKFRLSNVSAVVAISEGCVSNCSYCSVKLARGRLHSFDVESILSEIGDAVRKGYREILLTSQDTAAYGMDSGRSLPELLKEIVALDGKFKVRIGMMNPNTVKRILRGLLDVYESEKIYKFLHLPVESGSDEILAAMRRGYTVDEFLKIVSAFKGKFEDLYLATDIIVGFPGEGEREFGDTRKLIEGVRPDRVNLTRFSPMPGTEAAKMEQVDEREVKRRSKLLSVRCRKIGHEQNRRYIGLVTEGLVVEEGQKGGYVTRLPNYKPAILSNARLGDFLNVKITDARQTYLVGEPIG
ncbi:MAG: tRNA (N(6)-L-threonylcarbamoyladenosine(37)-C(2))-methylthiotransferase [Candidatus Hodarchaeaceae archaeon]|nr:tRNA (N(6)-L-threonylcarbamoyladenosine(37)-C(2))-methylthiotransferase [Candidatus Hodarchaeaceae archaeon]